MGIRIRKMMGYGLTDLTYEGLELTDPRINLSLFQGDDDRLYDICHEFDDWVQGKLQRDYPTVKQVFEELGYPSYFAGSFLKSAETRQPSWPSNLVTYDSEFGDGATMLFVPYEYPRWFRTNDDLDYYDHFAVYGEPTVKVHELKDGIHPFGQYHHLLPDREAKMDPEWFASQDVDGRNPERLHGSDYNHLRLYGPEEVKGHLEEDYRSMVPPSIALFAKFANIFTDPNTVHYLKPILYTYWG